MNGGNLLTFGSVFYSLLLIVIYFKKDRIKSIENKIYSYLIICNFLGLIIAITCYYTVLNYTSIPNINYFISRLYLVYLVIYIMLFFFYLIKILYSKSEILTSKMKKFLYCLIFAFIIICSLVYILPLNYNNTNGAIYSYGPAANIIYVFATLCMCAWTILLLVNIKKVKNKKMLPVILFIVGAAIVTVIQKINPSLLLMTSMETFVLVVMYFTIENPDKKILDEVHRAKEISDNSNEEKSMFLYNMTNEIRSITKDINSSASEILDETDNKDVNIENISNSARDIMSSTAKFTSMTNEVLDVSSIDAANTKIYNDKYNVKLILKELVQIYKKKAEDRGLEFRTIIDSSMPEHLYGDSVGLKTVLNTILDNAVTYTENGYIEFNVNTIIKNDIVRLIVTVEDSGVGIKVEDLNKIFNKVTNTNEEKLNLNSNLYNAKKLITLMGGTIIPSSVYGKGTTIKIVLDQRFEEEESTLDKYEKVYDKKRILLIDDSEASEKLIRKMLNNTNIEIEYVSLGKEGLDKIRNKEKYDLILLDEEMEPLDGIVVMKKLKEVKNFNTKVILLTRNNEYEYNEEYKVLGFTDYLLKPIVKEKLIETIDKYLNE